MHSQSHHFCVYIEDFHDIHPCSPSASQQVSLCNGGNTLRYTNELQTFVSEKDKIIDVERWKGLRWRKPHIKLQRVASTRFLQINNTYCV